MRPTLALCVAAPLSLCIVACSEDTSGDGTSPITAADASSGDDAGGNAAPDGGPAARDGGGSGHDGGARDASTDATSSADDGGGKDGGAAADGGAGTTDAGGSASDGGSGTTDAGGGTCGNGVVDPGEACDTKIPYGTPGSCPDPFAGCPVLVACVTRVIQGADCQARCADGATITQPSPKPDMCCPPGSAAGDDPDCPSAYPVDDIEVAPAIGGLGSCGSGTGWEESDAHVYMALGPTCGIPVIVTVAGESPGNGYDLASSTLSADAPGATLSGPLATSLDALQHDPAQASFLVGMSSATASFATVSYQDKACDETFTTTSHYDARPFVATPAYSGTSPTRVRLAGDPVGQYLVVEDGGAVKLVAGRYVPTQWSDGPTRSLLPASFTRTGAATLSAAGHDAALAVQTTAQLTTFASAPIAHVVWVEGSGAASTLRYARVTSDGTATPSTLRTGDTIATPQITVFDDQTLAVVWTEVVSGKRRLELARVAMASGALASGVVDVTHGEGDATEPSLAVAWSPASPPAHPTANGSAGVAFVDTRSGARALYFQAIDLAGTVTLAPELVTSAAVSPAAPSLQALSAFYPLFRVGWTDARDGASAVYVKDDVQTSPSLTAVAFAANPDSRVSPAGESAHDVRLGQLAPEIDSKGAFQIGGSPLFDVRAVWESASGVRWGIASSQKGEPYAIESGSSSIPLTCAAASASADTYLTVSEGWEYTIVSGSSPMRVESAVQIGAWVEGTSVMLQSLFIPVAARTALP